MADTGLTSPTTNGTVSNEWSNPADAYSSGSGNAFEATDGQKQDYGGYGFSLTGKEIDGIIVRLDAEATNSRTISVDLSWDNGSSWTAVKTTGAIGGTIETHNLGGATDTWGHAFTAAEVANGSLLVRVMNNGGATTWLDWVPVTVYYSGFEYTLDCVVGAFTLTGIAAVLNKGYSIVCTVGAFTLTGIAALFHKTLSMSVTVGEFALTGITTVFTKALNMSVTVGQFILTGIANLMFVKQWTETTKNTSSWTNESKNTSSHTNQTKNTSSWVNQDKK